MIGLAASLLLQIICVVHVIRTGRSQLWIMAIMFLSVAGCMVYFLLEVAPNYWGNRHVRTVRSQVKTRLDPERDLRNARAQLELADTVANRIDVADALAALGRHGEAEGDYREALARTHGDDWNTETKLARTLFENGKSAEALERLDAIPPATVTSDHDKRALLRARLLADVGRDTEARASFEDVVTRMPGEEARCHYAAFLIDRKDRPRALQILEEVDQRARRLDRTQRAAEAEMYKWAAERLQEIRAN